MNPLRVELCIHENFNITSIFITSIQHCLFGQREDLAIAVLISGACGFFGFAGFLQVITFGLPLCGDTAMA